MSILGAQQWGILTVIQGKNHHLNKVVIGFFFMKQCMGKCLILFMLEVYVFLKVEQYQQHDTHFCVVILDLD